MINCPKCQSRMRCTDSRVTILRTRRNYKCPKCDYRFTTHEIIVSDSDTAYSPRHTLNWKLNLDDIPIKTLKSEMMNVNIEQQLNSEYLSALTEALHRNCPHRYRRVSRTPNVKIYFCRVCGKHLESVALSRTGEMMLKRGSSKFEV